MIPATSDTAPAADRRQFSAKPDPVMPVTPPRETNGMVLLRWCANPWLQIAFNVLIVTASEIFLKLGARETATFTSASNWTGLTGLLSWWTWLGILFLILSLVSWLYVLRHVALSVAFPLSNAVHVFVPFASWFYLGERIAPTRWWGITLVIIGLIIVAKPFSRIEEKL